MKNNHNSPLDVALFLIQKYLPQKKPITNPIKLKPENRKLTLTLGKWAKPYYKLVKQLGLFK
tara:strand:- start:785 stop:970 length:186 start_codon:yes stop_codon:yes gene_type:complete